MSGIETNNHHRDESADADEFSRLLEEDVADRPENGSAAARGITDETNKMTDETTDREAAGETQSGVRDQTHELPMDKEEITPEGKTHEKDSETAAEVDDEITNGSGMETLLREGEEKLRAEKSRAAADLAKWDAAANLETKAENAPKSLTEEEIKKVGVIREVSEKKLQIAEHKVRSLQNAGDYAGKALAEAKQSAKAEMRQNIAEEQGVSPAQVILTAAQERHAEATVENDKELLYRLRKEGHEKEIGYEEDAIVGRTGDSLWKNLPKEKRVQKEQALRDAIREEWGGVEDPSGFEAFYRQLSLARETNDQKKIGELQAKLEKRFPGEGQAIMDALGRSDNLRSSSTIMLQKRMLVVLEQDKENGTNNYDSIKKWLDDESVPPNLKLKKLDELIEQLQRTREEQGLKRDERLDGLKHAENTMEKESIRQAMKEEIAVLEEREQDIELQFAIIDPQLAESRVPEARVPVAKLITDGGFEIANEMMAGGIEKMPDGTIRGKVGGDEWVYIRERENPDAGGGAAHRTLHPGRQRRSDPVSAHPSERSRLRHGPREEGRDRHGFQSARREPDAPRAVHAVGGGCDVHGHVTGGVPPRSRRDPRGRADHSGSHRRHQRDGALQ